MKYVVYVQFNNAEMYLESNNVYLNKDISDPLVKKYNKEESAVEFANQNNDESGLAGVYYKVKSIN